MDKEIFVYISLKGQDYFVGRLWAHYKNSRETATFEYDKSWLDNPIGFSLEPALKLSKYQFHTNDGQKIFGALGDSAPDRWGRLLMQRKILQDIKYDKKNRSSHLTELDYLLGVNDVLRQGALRFKENIEGKYQSHGSKQTIPPLVSLPKLLAATEKFLDKEENLDDLKLLLAPGSSLGGARPKASVIDNKGNISLAKFLKKDDEYDVVLWEAISLKLGEMSGIPVPKWEIKKILGKNVLIVKRFDRDGYERIPFLSAMSMLGANDNEFHSYLEIAYAIIQNGSSVKQNLEDLWRRIVFNIMISNTDDHLRNHGFLYKYPDGWCLSPAYDLNPTPTHIKPRVLSTAIDFDNHTASIELALSVIGEFRIDHYRAKEVISEVRSAVSRWREIASVFGACKKDIEYVASAFDHSD